MSIVNVEQIVKVLRQYNPWWRNPSEINDESKPQKRVAFYEAFRMVTHRTLRRFVVLSGARRVGKTTIMYQMIEELIKSGINPKSIVYITFDNPIVKLVDVMTVLSTYESMYPSDAERYLFFDEIQYTDHWVMILATSGQHSCNLRTSIPVTSGQLFL